LPSLSGKREATVGTKTRAHHRKGQPHQVVLGFGKTEVRKKRLVLMQEKRGTRVPFLLPMESVFCRRQRSSLAGYPTARGNSRRKAINGGNKAGLISHPERAVTKSFVVPGGEGRRTKDGTSARPRPVAQERGKIKKLRGGGKAPKGKRTRANPLRRGRGMRSLGPKGRPFHGIKKEVMLGDSISN